MPLQFVVNSFRLRIHPRPPFLSRPSLLPCSVTSSEKLKTIEWNGTIEAVKSAFRTADGRDGGIGRKIGRPKEAVTNEKIRGNRKKNLHKFPPLHILIFLFAGLIPSLTLQQHRATLQRQKREQELREQRELERQSPKKKAAAGGGGGSGLSGGGGSTTGSTSSLLCARKSNKRKRMSSPFKRGKRDTDILTDIKKHSVFQTT